jgi:hypothetical protein
MKRAEHDACQAAYLENLALGYSQRGAANKAGVVTETATYWERDPEFARKCELARGKAAAGPELAAYRAACTDPYVALKWLAQTGHPGYTPGSNALASAEILALAIQMLSEDRLEALAERAQSIEGEYREVGETAE